MSTSENNASQSDDARAKAELRQREARVAILRGAEARSLGRRFWMGAGAIMLVVFAVALVASFISVANANARVDRLKAHGISVVVTVGRCVGNLSGSGSNVSGYRCQGSYRVGSTTFHEPIEFKTTFSPPGSTVRGLADPAHHSGVALASAIRKSPSSPSSYLAPIVLSVLFVALALMLVRTVRRSPLDDETPSDDAAGVTTN
jgi:hypothetical protein